jgi:signal peptidase I
MNPSIPRSSLDQAWTSRAPRGRASRRRAARNIVIVVQAIACAAALGAAGLVALAFGPSLLGYESLIVANGSMGKAMPLGSVAVTRMVEVRAIETGDIVSYKHEGASMPVTHRVASIQEEGGRRVITTKGDANPAADPIPLVVSDGRIARVERVVPFAGRLIASARTPLGSTLLLVLPAAGLILGGKKKARTQTEHICAHCGAPATTAR